MLEELLDVSAGREIAAPFAALFAAAEQQDYAPEPQPLDYASEPQTLNPKSQKAERERERERERVLY